VTALPPAIDPVPERGLSLPARIAGVLFSPRSTYADVSAHPRIAGVLLVTVLATAGLQAWVLSGDAGQRAIAGALEAARTQGGSIPESLDSQTVARVVALAVAGASLVIAPLVLVVMAGVVGALCNALLDQEASFRHVYAVFAHAGVVSMVGGIFRASLQQATGDLSSPTRLGVFVPSLPEDGFAAALLGAVDLVWIWWIVNLAIGLAVLYQQRTGAMVATLLGIYGTLALLYAAVTAF
jgi:hypothetical protein